MVTDALRRTSVADLLGVADDLLTRVVPGTRGLWPRVVAFLLRMALEQALDEYWAQTFPGLADCPMAVQLVCAREYLDEQMLGQLAATWSALSRACHYHTYELAPTVAELRRWHQEATEVAGSLSAVTP